MNLIRILLIVKLSCGYLIEKQSKVAICSKDKMNIKTRKFVINECSIDDATTAAIVLDRDKIEELNPTDLPIIFYDYLLPEVKDNFKNSIAMFSQNKTKYAYLYLLKEMDWNRVAIVSDLEPKSEEFEKELSDLFNENEIVHVTEICKGFMCDFDEALNELTKWEPRIIIANVGEEYAANLVYNINKYNLNGDNNIVWIARDWPKRMRGMQSVLSIRLAPSQYHEYVDVKTSWTLRILDILSKIQLQFGISNQNKTLITNELKKRLNKETTRAVVWKLNSFKNEIIGSLEIKANGETKNIGEINKPISHTHDNGYESVKSSNFSDPNGTFLFFMVLIMATIILCGSKKGA